jgi:hypothetical protein
MSNKNIVKGLLMGARKICNSEKFFCLKQDCLRPAFYGKWPALERVAPVDFSLRRGLFCGGFFPILVGLRVFMADRRVNHLLENRKWQIPAIYAI